MSDEKRREALERAQKAIARSETFQRFLDDPDIAAYFAAYEQDCIAKMLRADPSDDETRRSEALRCNAMRQLRSFMHAAVQSREHAMKTIMKDSKHNG